MHQSSYNIISRFRELVRMTFQQGKVNILDVGSYGVNGTYKEIFADSGKYLYTGLDVNPGPNVDYTPADPYQWPELKDESFDVIISGQAFEHIEYPWLIIEEMNRVLKKNGLMCIVAPSRGPEHKYPVDCWRYYPDGFRALAKWVNLEVLEAKATWGKSGFNDGSDQWGDAFCILFKPENQKSSTTHKKNVRNISLATNRAINRNNPLNQNKQDSYYGFARPEVVQVITNNKLSTGKVLEIGCAGGATGKELKNKLPVQYYVGIDISPEAANLAKNHLDRVIVANIEETDLASEHGLKHDEFDLLLALDVLEHLYNPWDTLSELSSYVKPGGYVVVSLPNIQNITIVQELIKGNWQYQDAGILDATHLRFFTLETAKKMFSGAGLSIKSIEHVLIPTLDMDQVKESGNKYHDGDLEIVNLTKNDLLHLFTYQYIIIAQKAVSTMLNAASSNSDKLQGNLLLPQFDHDNIVPQMTSIIILTFNQLEYTKKCVKSLQKHTPEHHEIIFIDNASTDGTVKWLKAQLKENKNYKLIENKENLGFAKGCNQGINASRSEFILLLNNDVVVSQSWLAGLHECLNSVLDAGIVGPMTNNISGLQQIIDDEYRTVDYLDKYAAKFREQHRHRRIPLRRIVGFCMLFKKSLTEKIGLLDESFGTGNFEDDDFCLRAALEGYKNYIAGDVFIHHFGSRSFIGNKIDYSAAMSGNRKIIDKKWTLSAQSKEGKKLASLRAVELAYEFYQQGKIDQAIETLVNCIKLTPDAKEIYYALVRMFIEIKRFDDAQEVIGTMSESVKSELTALEYAGYVKEGLGLDDEAALYVEKILSQNENASAALNLLGILAYKKGDKEKAQNYFKKAIDSDPGYGEAYTNLGVLYWGFDNKKEEALAYLKKGFILSPAIPDAISLYYSIISSLDMFGDAESDFREALKLHPLNKNIHFLYIDILIRQVKYDQAMPFIEDVLDLFGLDQGILEAALTVREKVGPLQITPSNRRGSLSLCMIVKNEEKHLVKCLKSVRGLADEIIIVDTGSTDRTKDIARIFGAKVFEFPWTGDFSAARNHSLQQAQGEWILILDADEALSASDSHEMRSIIHKRTTSPAAYTIVTRNYTNNVSVIGWTANNGQYLEEAGAGWVASSKVRLFPRRNDIFFIGPVHELLEASIQNAKIPIAACNVSVHHYGKLDMERDIQKGEAYYLLGKMKYESDPKNTSFISELARQAYALNKHEEAVELWLQLIEVLNANPQIKDYPLAEIHTQLASSYLMLDRFYEALKYSGQAMTSASPSKETAHVYASCEIIAGSLDQAHFALDNILKTTPEYIPALFLITVIHCLQGDKDKTKQWIKLLQQKRVRITPEFNKMARRLCIQGKKAEAILLISTMTENNINDAETDSLLHNLRG